MTERSGLFQELTIGAADIEDRSARHRREQGQCLLVVPAESMPFSGIVAGPPGPSRIGKLHLAFAARHHLDHSRAKIVENVAVDRFRSGVRTMRAGAHPRPRERCDVYALGEVDIRGQTRWARHVRPPFDRQWP